MACSGGVDSVVLADLLCLLGYDIALAHCNFGLRPPNSDEEQAFVQSLAATKNIAFHTKHFDTKSYAAKHKVSVQMAARTLRYTWFSTLCDTRNYDYLLTAHHADDQAETMFFNLTKGGGIAAFHGIPEKRGRIVRPLLWAGKSEILDYAQNKQLNWREDSSNLSEDYQRNYLRIKVLPLLKNINPKLCNSCKQTADRILETEKLLAVCKKKFSQENIRKQKDALSISVSGLKNYGNNAVLLYQILKPYGFTYTQAQQIVRSAAVSGKYFYAEKYRLLKNRDELRLTGIPEENQSRQKQTIKFDLPEACSGIFSISDLYFTWKIEENTNFLLKSAPFKTNFPAKKKAVLDLATLHFPLEFRYWQAGDRFQPLGMQGRKRISDFLTDSKLSLPEKAGVRVMQSAGEIVWVVGHRIGHPYRIRAQTRKILTLELLSSDQNI